MITSLPTKRISAISQWETFTRVLPTRWRRKPAGTEITSLSPMYTFSTSLCWASTRHHATRICCWAPARLQVPVDICRKRSRSAANQPHAAAAIDRRDRQTDTWPLYGPCSAYHASIVINGNNVRSYKYRITSSHLPSNTSPCNQLCLHHWIRTKVNFFTKDYVLDTLLSLIIVL